MDNKTNKIEFEFTLVLDVDELSPEAVDALFEAGCDDSTITSRCGRVYLSFIREAVSLKDAILSAIFNVRKANIGVDIFRVDDCSFVTQSDIARRIGRTRQLVQQYTTGERGPGGFPGPIYETVSGRSLWSWREVAHWLRRHDMLAESDARDAEEVGVVNTVLELFRQGRRMPELSREVICAVGEPIEVKLLYPQHSESAVK